MENSSSRFIHLHVHSHYSILDGMSKIEDLVDKCRKNGMNALALTDHGNMYGIKAFTDYVNKVNGATKSKLKDAEKSLSEATDDVTKTELQKKVDELKAKKASEIPFKPIIGTEAYCARRTLFDKDKNFREINPESGREHIVDRSGWHLIILAKNKKGYQNLCKLSSQAYVDGFYDRPRIDKNILEKYHEGLIVCSACLGGELPQLIIANKLDEAEKSARWFKSVFGDDYYIEIQRHQTDKPNASTDVFERQQQVIPYLVNIAKKLDIKIIATNDVHFVEENHAEAHDRLICLSTGRDFDDPNRMHYTKQEWLKTPQEMADIFPDYPEAITNTLEIADKVENYSIESGPIMPKFDIPEDFGTEESYRKRFTDDDLFNEFTRNERGETVMSKEDADSKIKKIGGYQKLYRIKLEADYLSKLAWEGARERYGAVLTWNPQNNLYDVELDQKKKDQINFELHVMKTMGFPGYFLIVRDYIRAAREELGMLVGPGRGSAAGSVVAYCLKITDIDPLIYDLLFERFLNPDRISLPDIDVDFEDTGKILEWVTNKYGREKVARIITYGTMATKSSLADVARVQKVPLNYVNELKSFIPDKFDDFIDPESGKTFAAQKKKAPKVKLKNCYKLVPELKEALHSPDPNISTMLEYAEQLEDTNRQIGIHACGVIIGADDLTNFAPMCTVKDKDSGRDVLVTQYDGHVIESVGLIKMDFLGLITLSLIKKTIQNVKKSQNIDIDIDHLPLDDELTYKLFSEGKTVGVFQFESPGMQKYLRELKPSVISDLIAMNALYRPGPIEYIPKFIRRKKGEEPITYDIQVMEKYLKDTYGVTVYQEQVMLLSRLLADFTRGQSDALRKAMGKKQIAILNELKPKFIDGGKKNGHDPEVLEKIWKDWEAFASYAFNKSHAACYAWVAYQTGFLKAHYPAEYMAANLTISKDTASEVAKFMEEAKAMKIPVKGPDINESEMEFAVKNNVILFGLGGIKGVGEAAVEAIISEREKNGPYKNIFDFVERVNLSACNRKTVESMALAGAFDGFRDIKREQFMVLDPKGSSFCDTLIKYGNRYQQDKNSTANTLFGGGSGSAVAIAKPEIPQSEDWSVIEKLNREKELVGIYLSAHPLDPFRLEIENFCNVNCQQFAENNVTPGKDLKIAGMITAVDHRISQKNGNGFGFLTLEDFTGSYRFALFGKTYVQFKNYLTQGTTVLIKGKMQPKYNNPQEFDFQFTAIDLLADVKDKMLNSITLKVPITELDNDLLATIKEITTLYKGSQDLRFSIFDPESKIAIKMHSRSLKISICKDLIKMVEESGIEYSVA